MKYRKKKLILCLSVLFLSFVYVDNIYGDEKSINLQFPGHHGTHNEVPTTADLPDVYYDDVNQEIIIDGTGYVSYYDVEIMSTSNWIVYVSTQVNGSYDTIDISSLPEGEYSITIDSPTGNSFEGFIYCPNTEGCMHPE